MIINFVKDICKDGFVNSKIYMPAWIVFFFLKRSSIKDSVPFLDVFNCYFYVYCIEWFGKKDIWIFSR
jgi:hypothetical protein